MKKLTVGKQIVILISFMLFIQIVIGLVGYSSLTSIKGHLFTVFNKRLPSINSLVQADRDFQQMLVAERTLLIEDLSPTQKERFLKEYNTNRKQVLGRFENYKKLGLTQKEKKISDSFYASFKAWEEASNIDFIISGEKLNNGLNHKIMTKKSLGSLNQKFEAARGELDTLQELILSYGESEFSAAEKAYTGSISTILVITVLGLVGSVIFGFIIGRGMSVRIGQRVKNVSNEEKNLDQISKTLEDKSESLTSISHELSSAVTETTSSLHEISQMIKNNTEGSQTVSKLIEKGKELIQTGVNSLKKLDDEIRGVEQSSGALASTVEKSNQELLEIIKVFEEVNDKTKVINDIVFQTKLLSFNASVEAARAGENGKGFSVVAEEVGNLAKVSGESADEISKLLSESLEKVSSIVSESSESINSSVNTSKNRINDSVSLSLKCQELFRSVRENFDQVSRNSNEVALASKEQLTGVEEVNRAMEEITNSANITKNSASEVSSASIQLGHSVNEISQNVIGLKSLIEKNKAAIKKPKKELKHKEKSEGQDDFDLVA